MVASKQRVNVSSFSLLPLDRDLTGDALDVLRGATGGGSSSQVVDTEAVLGGIRTLEALVQVGEREGYTVFTRTCV